MCGKKILEMFMRREMASFANLKHIIQLPFQHCFKHQHRLTFSWSFLMGTVSQVTAPLNSVSRSELEGIFIITFYNYSYLTKKAAIRYSQSLNGPKYCLQFIFLAEWEIVFFILMCRSIPVSNGEKKNKLFTISQLPTVRLGQGLPQHWKGQQNN